MADQAEELRAMMKSLTPEHNDKKLRIITIASGKGGVGKTNVSVNLALAYARLGKKVIVMDADLGLANINVIMGVIPKYNLYHVVRKQKTMREVIIETNYGIQIVPGASGFSKIANLDEDERQNFVTQLQELAYADILIVDTSAGVSGNVLSFVEAADDVLIVTTPEPTAITDAYGLIKIISTEIESQDFNLKLIINRAQSVTEAKKVQQRVIAIASQFLNLKLDYLGFIYDDPVVSQSVRKQVPFLVAEPKSRPSECVMHIVSKLEKIDYRSEGSGMAKLVRKFLNPRHSYE
ncbi:MAG: MinD/ParA family protein [Spirochaetaceae bacterium]|nr:MinD/ParA family protein [Spirochaetaceae bacterium]